MPEERGSATAPDTVLSVCEVPDTGSGLGGQMDRGQFGQVDDDVDAGDSAFGDGEGDEGERGSVGAPGHVAGVAVDQHGPLAGDLAGEHAGPGGDLGGAEGDDH